MTPRLIKEVSVAGESPDMSEQRKSSGTAEGRDPRLAVFREPGAAPGANTAGGTTGAATDGETAVFRLPHSGKAGAPAGGSASSEGPEGASGPRGGAEGVGDAEKAAGTVTGAPEAPSGAEESAPAATETETETDAASEAEAGSAAAADADSGRPEAGEQPEAGAGDAEAAPGVSGSRPDADADAEANADVGSEPEAESEADAEATPADTRLRAAVAAWVATDEEAAVQGGADEGVGKPSDGDDVSASDSGDAVAAAADRKPSDSDAPNDDSDSDDSDAASDAGSDDSDAASDAEAPAGSDADEAADSEVETVAGTDDVPAVSAPGGAPRVPKTREEAAPAEEPEPARDGRGIDHPTAVFKAPRVGQVDQPTTALKIPPKEREAARKPASWAAGEASGAPETPAERTSKFVPLRSDDVRPAAVVGPTVTPDVAAKPGTPGAPGAGLTEAERTRQQPMPPKPPLDLLAELTNTPPPPETPVRTAVRRVKIWTPLVLLLLVAFAIAQAMRPLPEPVLELTAKQTYDFAGSKPSLPWPDEGQGFMAATGLGTVDSFGEQKAVPIGSVAKAMTAYVVLKDHPLKRGEDGPAVKIDAKAEEEGKLDSVGESTLNTVKAGETITQQDALAAIMVPSANNIARLLARWDAGSEEAFVKKMNDTAKELGMENTTYTDPSGLNATTVSSAEDQVKLGEKLVEIPALMDITKLPSWTDPSGQSHRNYNTLVPYDGALGIKTGSTTKAGGNLLFAAHKKVGDTDQLIVGAILGQHKPPIIDTVNAVSKEAMTATQDLLESRTVVKKGQVVGVVDDGFGRTTDVVVAEDVKAVGWPGLTVKLELTDDGKTIPNAAAAGTRVGTMTVGEGASQVEVAVTLGTALAEPSFGDKLTRIN
ncbi:D-alanyl-D-alanine carboxypeptidase [Streptomyces atroolivaceus]|uniref:D-alanyl-D-alanine carboxypeptidase n=1 Tax=Streptomyces atroolivaceus TaxID=66869 RepID=UPI003657CF6A